MTDREPREERSTDDATDVSGGSTDRPIDTRELGIDFGEFHVALMNHSYPTTTEELLEECGEYCLELPGGSQTVAETLGLLADDDETYESVEEARQAIFNTVDSHAIGRKYYSDRTPPALGENRPDDQLSF